MIVINIIVLILVIIGALNWGFVGFFNYNVISAIFGGPTMGDYTGFERFIYAIVGLCGIWALSFFGRMSSGSSDDAEMPISPENKDQNNDQHK